MSANWCTEACVAPHQAPPVTRCVLCGRELRRGPTGYFYRIGPAGLEPEPQMQETAEPPAD